MRAALACLPGFDRRFLFLEEDARLCALRLQCDLAVPFTVLPAPPLHHPLFAGPGGLPTLFADGSCLDGRDPLLARAGWGLTDGLRSWSGGVQGKQSAIAAELAAFEAALLRHPCGVHVVSDCQIAVPLGPACSRCVPRVAAGSFAGSGPRSAARRPAGSSRRFLDAVASLGRPGAGPCPPCGVVARQRQGRHPCGPGRSPPPRPVAAARPAPLGAGRPRATSERSGGRPTHGARAAPSPSGLRRCLSRLPLGDGGALLAACRRAPGLALRSLSCFNAPLRPWPLEACRLPRSRLGLVRRALPAPRRGTAAA